MQRNLVRQGFGLVSNQNRDRMEFSARFQSIWGKNTFKYGFEFNDNRYKINTHSSGPGRTFTDNFGEEDFDSMATRCRQGIKPRTCLAASESLTTLAFVSR